ncbi:MAG: cell division protein FtsA [Candidatus Eisenbacteria bacterium]|nr:cell division protein FtsA [Candidatus Latescibacterota bacterium]MBD3301778.1 cell division protein FtsA [Candidatus Eisenbacteria bacterium]
MAPNRIFAGLDIGTTKVCCTVGESLSDREIRLLGWGSSPCAGLERGSLVNLESTAEAIATAVDTAARMAGVTVRDAYVGISGEHLRGVNSRGVIGISRRDKEIVREDIERVLEAARAVKIPADREVLHVIPRGFTLDGQSGIRDPVGMSGVRLEAEVHIVTFSSVPVRNLLRAVDRAGLDVEALVLQPLAASLAVLEEDERALGVALLDIGGGTTDLICFENGVVQHTAIIGVGGRHLTQDIAIGLRTPKERAEELKVSFGSAISSLVPGEEVVEVPGVGGRGPRQISRQVLAAILEPRAEEILTLAFQELERCGVTDLLAAGIVVTGGSALLPGMTGLAERVLGLPTRIGRPGAIEGLSEEDAIPQHAAGIGILRYAAECERARQGAGKGILGFLRRPIREWVRDYL